MAEAIIFDCFGVLTTEGWLAFKQRHFGGNPEKLRRASEVNRLLDAAQIDYRNGVQEIADLSGVDFKTVDKMLRKVAPNEELLAYIREELEPNYKLGILSNVAGNWLEAVLREKDLQLFDAVALSYQHGVLKPNIQSYENVASRLGVKPKECVFIDDQERHCEGARRVGMRPILYKNFEQMKNELEELLSADAKG